MLKGLRWQILALITAIMLFGTSLLVRITTAPDIPPPVVSGPVVEQNTLPDVIPAEETPLVAIAGEPTPLPTDVPAPTPITQSAPPSTTDELPTFIEGIVGQIQRLNPLFADLNPVDRDITRLIFNGLTRINEYGEPVSDLAENWVVSRDGIEYVFRLRNDVLWQDGMPFTADDVIFTMALLADDNFTVAPELGRFWRTVEVQKIAPDLVRFRLAQPLASFLVKLNIGILPQHILRGTRAQDLAQHPFNLSPVGTGAYQLEALRTFDGERIQLIDLRLSATYQQWSGEVYAIPRLRFHSFDTFSQAVAALNVGTIHALATQDLLQRGEMLNAPNTQPYTTVSQRVGMLIFNWNEGEDIRFFSEQRVRVALQIGLNTRVPVESRLANRAISADSPLAIGSWAYASIPRPNNDTGMALQMLQSANIRWHNGITPPDDADEDATSNEAEQTTASRPELSDISFSIMVTDLPALVGLAEEIAVQWSILGINVTVESLDTPTYQQRLEDNDFHVAIAELPIGADPDIYRYWHGGQYPDGLNYGAVIDDRLSELLERARRDANGVNRIALYRDAQARFVERAVAIPLYYPLFTYVVNRKVEGVQLGFTGNPSDRFRTLRDWQFNTP